MSPADRRVAKGGFEGWYKGAVKVFDSTAGRPSPARGWRPWVPKTETSGRASRPFSPWAWREGDRADEWRPEKSAQQELTLRREEFNS